MKHELTLAAVFVN